MSNTFNKNNCFGANREPLDAGSYIQKKKARATYCNSNVCIKKNTGTYENYNLLHKAEQLDTNNCYLTFYKYNLNRNLFTELNTSGLCVLQDASSNACATTIDPSLNIYDSYIIDPSGVLFGNSFCGINNYVNLMTPINNITYDLSGNYIISSNSDYNTIITFIGNGTFTLTSGKLSMDILSVGGGGGGGSGGSNASSGGGGGGGEVKKGSYYLNVIDTMYITIGNGGNGGLTDTSLNPLNYSGQNGQNTTITYNSLSIVAKAGFGGIKSSSLNGGNGGSSGSNGTGGLGSFSPVTLPTIGINGGGGGGGGYFALNGANGSMTTANGFLNIQNYGAGGGGGAGDGAVTGGAGGNIYAGNGGRCINPSNPSNNGSSAIANYGGGGGGGIAGNGIVGTSGNGGNGGSGLVILAFNV
jgi:hypothetical protein